MSVISSFSLSLIFENNQMETNQVNQRIIQRCDMKQKLSYKNWMRWVMNLHCYAEEKSFVMCSFSLTDSLIVDLPSAIWQQRWCYIPCESTLDALMKMRSFMSVYVNVFCNHWEFRNGQYSGNCNIAAFGRCLYTECVY